MLFSKSLRRLLFWIGVSAAVLFILRMEFPRPFWHSILPFTAASPSTSLENYTLDLKVDLDPRSKSIWSWDDHVATWRVDVPRAYVNSEIGTNGRPGDRSNSYIVGLAVVRNKDGNDFTPAVFTKKSEDKDIAFISLSNSFAGERLAKTKQCVRVNDRGHFYGSKNSGLPGCDTKNPQYLRCPVSAHYQGWKVEILMPRHFYAGDYQAYCDAALDFVGRHTVEIAPYPRKRR